MTIIIGDMIIKNCQYDEYSLEVETNDLYHLEQLRYIYGVKKSVSVMFSDKLHFSNVCIINLIYNDNIIKFKFQRLQR